ncbi:uncharacterized protein ACBT44_017670 [Syngnathus typhle]
MKRAVYSMEIKVERNKTTGETRVLSSNTKLPVNCSHGGIKVYEDEQKVVHEVNGQDGVHLLSTAEPECLGERRLRGRLSAVDHRTQSMAADQEVAPMLTAAIWILVGQFRMGELQLNLLEDTARTIEGSFGSPLL